MVHFRGVNAIFAFATSHLITSSSAEALPSPVVDLGYAKCRGNHNDTLDINEFLGLRFAEPPIGALRWKAPQPYLPSNLTNTTISATQSGSPCIQGYVHWTLGSPAGPVGSEDCLFLDIYVPANATRDGNLPVALSIPGGGYVMGYAGQSSPYALMRHSDNAFIFVNMQYRLGAYGFLGSSKYEEEGGAANIGLLDQRLAMQWVQDNIAAFGGDSEKVTILGGSAGGGSAVDHLIWEGGEVERPPFRAAMADFPFFQQYLREEQLKKQYNRVLSAASCEDLACLRTLSEEELQVATQATYTSAYLAGDYGYGTFYYGPYIDNSIIRALPSQELCSGRFSKVPTWTSREGYEGYTFTNFSLSTLSEEITDLKTQFPYAEDAFIDDLFSVYPREEFNSTFWRRATWFGDYTINCPSTHISASLAAADVPVYKQIFNVGTQLHGAPQPYLGDLNYASSPGANVTLANATRDWYISFIVYSDPNVQSWSSVLKPVWPEYKESGEVMSVNFTELGAVNDRYYDYTERCSFFLQNGEVVQN